MSSRFNYLSPYSYPYPYFPYRNFAYTRPYETYQAHEALRRSRVEVDLATRRIEAENALRRSGVQAQLSVSRALTENRLRRSRQSADLANSQIASEIALRDSARRSRVEHEVDTVLRRY